MVVAFPAQQSLYLQVSTALWFPSSSHMVGQKGVGVRGAAGEFGDCSFIPVLSLSPVPVSFTPASVYLHTHTPYR